MILNNHKPDSLEYEVYKLDEDAIGNASKLFVISKRDSVTELQDYIDNTILYFDRKAVMIRGIVRNEYSRFNNFMNGLRKKCNHGELNSTITIRVPNKVFYNIPVRSKLPVPFDGKPTWKKLKGDMHDYINPNSPLYCKAIRGITDSHVKKPSNISKLKMYDEIECKTSKEVLKALEEYHFLVLNTDADTIINYIDTINNALRELKYVPVASIEGSNKLTYSRMLNLCFMYVENMCTYYKNIINMLLQLYGVKSDIFFSGVIRKKLEVGSIVESMTSYRPLYEMSYYLSEGVDPKNMMESVNVKVSKDMRNSLDYIKEYIDNLYGNIKNELTAEYRDKFKYLGYFRFTEKDLVELSKSIEDVSDEECLRIVNKFMKLDYMHDYTHIDINNTKDLIGECLEKINHLIDRSYQLVIDEIEKMKDNVDTYELSLSNRVDIFDRFYDSMGIFIKTDIDLIRGDLMNDPYIRDFIIPKDVSGVITHGSLDPIRYGYLHHELVDAGKLYQAELLSRYYHTLSVSIKYANFNFGFDRSMDIRNTVIKLSTRLLAYIVDFQYKCYLLNM